MRVLRILLVVSLLAAPALADTLNFGTAAPGDLGTTHSYNFDGATITATAFNGGHLFGKTDGGDENGLGLTGDPSGNNEIYECTGECATPFIQLDLLDMLNHGYGPITISFGSTTVGEQWEMFACANAGGTGCGAGVAGTADGTFVSLPGNFSSTNHYIDVIAVGTDINGKTSNVLIGGVSSPVPEPGSMMLLGTGLAGLGGFIRRRVKR